MILGINANPVFAKDNLSELHSENEAGGADVTRFRKVEDGSVISNVHTSKWRIFTDKGRDLFLQVGSFISLFLLVVDLCLIRPVVCLSILLILFSLLGKAGRS